MCHEEAPQRLLHRIVLGSRWIWSMCNRNVTGSHSSWNSPGLAVEHCLEDQVRWSGNGGSTMFFQSELPYDVTAKYGEEGHVGYRVLGNVETHQAKRGGKITRMLLKAVFPSMARACEALQATTQVRSSFPRGPSDGLRGVRRRASACTTSSATTR